jgi:hypothetical protein
MVPLEVSLSKAWMARELGPVFDRDYYFVPRRRWEIDTRCDEYARRQLADLDACYTESNLGRRRYFAPAQVLIGGIQPNMILGMLLGAEFVPGGDKDADITPNCLAGKDLAELPSPDSLLAHPMILAFDEQFRETRRAGEWRPIAPLFWDTSGRPAVHGALTTAQKFLGESVFLDMMADPEPCRRLMGWVTEANIVLARHFADLSGVAISEIHVGECCGCMVNPKLFERFVAPEVSRIADEIAPVRLHSCGGSDHLIGAFRGIRGLASLDLGGDTSLAKVRAAFGRDFPVSIAPLVNDLTGDTPEGLLAWAERVLADNDGGPLVIACHMEPSYRLDVVRELRSFLASRA